ncbi:MAG: segregation and condensation protein A [Candidatus Sedimenticola sp. 20ELBAFRAG]
MSDNSKERDVMMVMRKVLASIIKDTTPPPGTRHPLSEKTIQDVRMCLGLISARERELADEAGAVVEKPYFVDEQPSSNVVSISNIGRTDKERSD